LEGKKSSKWLKYQSNMPLPICFPVIEGKYIYASIRTQPKQAKSAALEAELISHAKQSPGWCQPITKSFCCLIFISEFQFSF
jgi:hypothetical protein